jgi:hypothetical protein
MSRAAADFNRISAPTGGVLVAPVPGGWTPAGTLRTVGSALAVIAVDAVNPRTVADFWCAVLDWVVLEEDEAGISIGALDGGMPTIDVCRVPEAKSIKNRLHFDLRADGAEQPAELQRLLDLGAKPVSVGQQPDVTWVVLADPEGNEFCLLSRTVQEARQG